MPCRFGHPHCLELIDVVDISRGYTLVIVTNSLLEELGLVMSFKASNYALVIRLNMCCKICLKVFDSDVLEIGGNNMTREIVLEKQNFPFLHLKFPIPLLNPVLIQLSSHPHICIALVIKA